ncbi:hypothetical protein JW964_26525 [candidate division KSB1 bacterium]|nr:hypothetical protein [candidate division KSB1 bacterium]
MFRYFSGIIIISMFFLSGCVKKIPVSYNSLESGTYVYIALSSGESIKGEIEKIEDNTMVVRLCDDMTRTRKIVRSEIMEIRKRPTVYDEGKKVIPESSIKKYQKNINKWLFTIGGGALSFGITFFVTANILHETEDGAQGAPLWVPTGLGTLIGGTVFRFQGSRLDRHNAIEQIKEERKVAAIKEMNSTKKKRAELEKELKGVKGDREKQNQEINDLLKQINKKNKKEDE